MDLNVLQLRFALLGTLPYLFLPFGGSKCQEAFAAFTWANSKSPSHSGEHDSAQDSSG